MCDMACEIVQWIELHSVTLSGRYIPSKKNVLVDQLSHPDQVLLITVEWSLLPQTFETICEVFSHPHLELFVVRANAKLPLYVSPVPDLMA